MAVDPRNAAKQAVLGNKRTVEAYGRLLVECGLYSLPSDVLVGALLEVAKVSDDLDKERMEVWREAGRMFHERVAREQAARPRRPSRSRQEGGGPSAAANEG